MTDGFAHCIPLDQIRDGDRIALAADDRQRADIATRFGLRALSRLDAKATLGRDGSTIRARGRVQAALEQDCVVTGDPVATHVDEPFDLIFLAEPSGRPGDEEVELRAEDCDVIFHDGATIDLGEAIADTLGLGINPYPRSAGAEAALKDAGVLSEEEAGPFAALAQLRKGQGGNDS